MTAIRLSGGSKAISRAFTRAGELELPVELLREQGGQRWYGVPSATRPGTVHTVRVDPAGGLHCGCEAGAYGRHICWHRARVAQVLAAQAVRRVDGETGEIITPAVAQPRGGIRGAVALV